MRKATRRAVWGVVLAAGCLVAVTAMARDHGPFGRGGPGSSFGSSAQDEHGRHEPGRARTLVAFSSMYGVDGPFVGEAFAVRDVPGDELPWEIESARGRLDADGHLTIRVRGLVFKDDPSVPEEIRGINDESEFRALVSCLTEVGDAVVTANVITDGFPATGSGDSTIVTTVDLPDPCVAPIVMVLAGSEDKWFAMTGFESEEEGEEDGEDEGD